MKDIRRSICILLFSSVFLATHLFAADCASLKNLHLENTTITLADSISSGSVHIPGTPPISGLPAICRVAGILRPSTDSVIHFELWLPEHDWNGRFLGVGNGGFAGTIYYPQIAAYVKRGFAAAASDAGHQAEATDASWAYGHPEKIKDFGWRAVHLTRFRSAEIISAFYGKHEQKAYFDACSDGGREALVEAQRFPEDYDGILAGAPANAWSTMVASSISALQARQLNPASYFSDFKLPAIQKAALDACDALDRVKDGIINDPSQCHFDPQVLLCKGEDSLDCLTPPQVKSLNSIYTGSIDAQGKMVFPGFTPGDETGWTDWVIGKDPTGASAFRYIENYFRYMITGDPSWSVGTADFETSLRQSREKGAPDLDATSAELGRFASHGGKLILYHGWNDQAISPWNTIDYYKSVQQAMGADKAGSFIRLYMAPGVEHCVGGPGPSSFGQFGLEAAKGPKYGLFDSLVDWVEKGTPDEDIIATKYGTDEKGARQVLMTRPLCAYPKVPKYSGSGDSNDASNFTCAAPQ